jgi:four helix bundle protein
MAALQVAELSFQAIEALRILVARIKRCDRSLADQLRRAATSVALNIAEADGLEAGNRRLRFVTALGSAKESLAALKVAECWRYITPEEAQAASNLFRRIIAILWKLTH